MDVNNYYIFYYSINNITIIIDIKNYYNTFGINCSFGTKNIKIL